MRVTKKLVWMVGLTTNIMMMALNLAPDGAWAFARKPKGGPGSCDQPHELPLVTHWSDRDIPGMSIGFNPGASDQFTRISPTPMGSSYHAGRCYFAYGPDLVPNTDLYPADVFSIKKIDDSRVRQYAQDYCSRNGVPIRFYRPDLPDQVRDRLQSNAGVVQAVHGLIVARSLITIILPSNWTKDAPEGTYPIIANGNYDLNDSMFSVNGRIAADSVAMSGLQGRKGAIGILWNGGGAAGSRTTTPYARQVFNTIIDKVAREYGGDRHTVLMYGGSRGGMTALEMASNPDPHQYDVRFVYALVPGVKLGSHAYISPMTLPGMHAAFDYSLGLSDGWRPDWKYPSCSPHRDLHGLSGPEALLKVMVGFPDRDYVDREQSPISDRFLAELVRAKTELLLEISTHDQIIPFAHEAEYLRKARAAGIPVEASILVRAGHQANIPESWFMERFRPAVLKVVTPGAGSTGGFVNPALTRYYRLNRATGQQESFTPDQGLIPFTLEVPRKTYVGFTRQFIVTGDPGTEFEITLKKDPAAEPTSVRGKLDATGAAILESARLTAADIGVTTFPSVRIRREGQDWKTIDVTETPSSDRTALFSEVLGEIPNQKGLEMAKEVTFERTAEGAKTVSWGVSEW